MPMIQSPIERYVQGLLFGEQFKGERRQRRWESLRQELLSEQIEDIRQGRKAKQQAMALIKDLSPELQKAQALTEHAGMPWSTSLDVSGYVSPEQRAEKERTEMMGGLADIQAQPGGAYTLGKLFEEAPPGIKAKMIPLTETFPGMIPEEPKAPTPLAPTDYERRYPEDVRRRNRYQELLDKMQPVGKEGKQVFMGTPQEWAEFKVLEGQFGEKPKMEVEPTEVFELIDYINKEADLPEEAEAWLKGKGYTKKEIDSIIDKTKFGIGM